MSLFDTSLLVTVATGIVVVFLLTEKPQGWVRFLPAAGFGLAAIHLLTSWRLLFLPVYGVALALYLGLRTRGTGRTALRRVVGVLALLPLAVAGGLAWAFPVFRVPRPGGTYAVGSRWLALTDSSRGEDFTPDSADRRGLVVRLWYPTDSARGERAPFLLSRQAEEVALGLGLPGLVFGHLHKIRTNSYLDAPLSRAQPRWPVVLFSHGFGFGYESQNTVQMEALASHGFVVASIAHPYEAGVVVFPDGRVVRRAPTPPPTDTAALRRMITEGARLGSETDTTALRELVLMMHRTAPLDGSMARWTADTRFVADRLTSMSQAGADPGLWPGRLRTDRFGVFGMSFGGATAANFCTIDVRCAAGANLDGLTHGEATNLPMPRPFLFASSSASAHMHDLFYLRATAPVYKMTVAKTLHLDYTDLGLISPLFVKLGVLGGIPTKQMEEIMNTALLGYFSHYLREAPPLDVSMMQRFPAVSMEARVPVAPAVPPTL